MFDAIHGRRLDDDAPSVFPSTGALEKPPQVSVKRKRISVKFCRHDTPKCA